MQDTNIRDQVAVTNNLIIICPEIIFENNRKPKLTGLNIYEKNSIITSKGANIFGNPEGKKR